MKAHATITRDKRASTKAPANVVPHEITAATILLHTLFAGQAYAVLNPASEATGATAAGLGEWAASTSGAGLIAIGAVHTLKTWGSMATSLRLWIVLAFILVTPMVIRGFIEADGDPLYTALQSLPWMASVFLPALGAPTMHPRIRTALRWHLLVGVLVCALLLLNRRELIFSDYVTRSETLELSPMNFLLYSLFFQMFRFPEETLLNRVAVVAGILQMATVAIASGTRQPIIILATSVSIWVWIMLRAKSGSETTNRIAGKFAILVAFSLSIYMGITTLFKGMQGGADLITQRTLQESGSGSIIENSRWDEIAMLTSQFSLTDYVLGRGVRGSFVNYAAPKQDNVHIGWFRILLKGGVPVVILLLIGPALTGVRALLQGRDPIVLAAGGVGAYFMIKNSTGNVVLAHGQYYLICLCYGVSVSLFSTTANRYTHDPNRHQR